MTTTPGTSTTPGWEGLLDSDETIVWQGTPGRGFRFDFSNPLVNFMGLFFMGFSTFWMFMAAQGGGPFWMFGLLFFGIGTWNAFASQLWKNHLRRNTHYTLTTKRAFIASQALGRRSLESYPITPQTTLKFDGNEPATIRFADQDASETTGLFALPAAFEQVSPGREIYAQFRDVQRGLE